MVDIEGLRDYRVSRIMLTRVKGAESKSNHVLGVYRSRDHASAFGYFPQMHSDMDVHTVLVHTCTIHTWYICIFLAN